ncbi:hypothetical protein [Hyphomicrobium sp.]|uniref:hypothetical protein n=1 Tax=Hyphomicrobium sp. TaxID=82 RepID=UPI0025BBC070|nr:hypothetical protein [Hyphomicrobium sp.]
MSNQHAPDIRKVDRPELDETFVDSVGMFFFDGSTLRLEFSVTRFDEPKPPAKPSARRYPVARLVLDQKAAVDLLNQMEQVKAILQRTGHITKDAAKQVVHVN